MHLRNCNQPWVGGIGVLATDLLKQKRRVVLNDLIHRLDLRAELLLRRNDHLLAKGLDSRVDRRPLLQLVRHLFHRSDPTAMHRFGDLVIDAVGILTEPDVRKHVRIDEISLPISHPPTRADDPSWTGPNGTFREARPMPEPLLPR